MSKTNCPPGTLQGIGVEAATVHIQSQEVLSLSGSNTVVSEDARFSREPAPEPNPVNRTLHDIDFDKVLADLQLRGLVMRPSPKLIEAYDMLLKRVK